MQIIRIIVSIVLLIGALFHLFTLGYVLSYADLWIILFIFLVISVMLFGAFHVPQKTPIALIIYSSGLVYYLWLFINEVLNMIKLHNVEALHSIYLLSIIASFAFLIFLALKSKNK